MVDLGTRGKVESEMVASLGLGTRRSSSLPRNWGHVVRKAWPCYS